MKLLATATPNKRYRWYESLRGVVLQAKLSHNRVYYYEIRNHTTHNIAEATVRELFATNCRIIDRPFTKKGNETFYTVLHRHRKKYREQYLALKQPTFKRTR